MNSPEESLLGMRAYIEAEHPQHQEAMKRAYHFIGPPMLLDEELPAPACNLENPEICEACQ